MKTIPLLLLAALLSSCKEDALPWEVYTKTAIIKHTNNVIDTVTQSISSDSVAFYHFDTITGDFRRLYLGGYYEDEMYYILMAKDVQSYKDCPECK